MRSAEAVGCAGVVVLRASSVDVYNPKVVRASAGAVFGVPIVAARARASRTIRRRARRARGARAAARYGATVGGTPRRRVDLTGPVALVLGNEAHGLSDAVLEPSTGSITIPMAGAARPQRRDGRDACCCSKRPASAAPVTSSRRRIDAERRSAL